MNEDYFRNRMADIFATFGKGYPGDRIIDAIFRRVETLPDAFMDYALEQIQDLEKLPQNIGMHLRRELWPDYLDAHPELRETRCQQVACPKCKHDAPGTRIIYEPDGTSHVVACTCCTDPRRILTLGQPSDQWVLEHGFSFKNPQWEVDTETKRWLRQTVARANKASKEPIRRRHAEILRELDEEEQ